MSDDKSTELTESDSPPEPTLEDSMTVPDLSPPVQGKLISGVVHDINTALSQLVNLNSDNVYHEPTCKICNNPHREELETKWFETKKHIDLKAIVDSKSGIVITDEVIDNHFINHYNKGIKEIQKVEFLNKINRLNGINVTTLDRIRMGMSAITIRVMELNALTPGQNESHSDLEKLKSSETARLMGSFNQLLKIQAGILGEMKADGEIISLPSQQFVEVFNETILNAKTDGERELIKGLLVRLTDLSKFTQ